MKTQILQLEPHDDAVSIKDKIGWSQANRIALVWPSHGAPVTRRLDLALIQRHAARLGHQIALVTPDPEAARLAHDLKIPVFKDLKHAQEARWRVARRRKLVLREPRQHEEIYRQRDQARPRAPAWSNHPALRAALFSLAILALLGLAATALPSADIALAPAEETQIAEIELTASPAFDSVRLIGQVPARLETILLSAQDTLTTTGKVSVPENFATGFVRFTNLTESEVTLPRGLVVTTLPGDGHPPIRFATTSLGRVPAGVGKSTSLPIRALAPGPSGNLPAGSLTAIEDRLGLSVSASNLLPTSGGSSRWAPGASQSDYTQLYENTLSGLESQALAEFSQNLSGEAFLITPSLTLSRTLEVAYNPPEESQPVSSRVITLNLRVVFSIRVIARADVEELARQVLEANLPTGYAAVPDSLSVHWLSPIEAEGATARWRIQGSRRVQVQLGEGLPVQAITGKTPAEAQAILMDQLPLAQPPGITLTPTWWPRLPLAPLRIDFLIP